MNLQHQALGLVGLMAYLRVNSGSRGSLQMVEVLAAVAGGADTVEAIKSVTGASDRTIWRHLSTLRGRGSVKSGSYSPSALTLVETYRHPHIKNAIGFKLSPTGAAVLHRALGQ